MKKFIAFFIVIFCTLHSFSYMGATEQDALDAKDLAWMNYQSVVGVDEVFYDNAYVSAKFNFQQAVNQHGATQEQLDEYDLLIDVGETSWACYDSYKDTDFVNDFDDGVDYMSDAPVLPKDYDSAVEKFDNASLIMDDAFDVLNTDIAQVIADINQLTLDIAQGQ